MGRDLQFARTDRAIVEAVLRLLKQNSIERISIGDITEEAMVNRSTFYQHYPDKYAVLESLQKSYINELIERTQQAQASGATDFASIDAIFGSFFDTHRDTLKLLLSIRTETFDLRGELEKLLRRLLNEHPNSLTPLERDMMTAMWLRFFEFYLSNEKQGESYSTLFFTSCFHLSLTVLGIADKPAAADRMLALIKELVLE